MVTVFRGYQIMTPVQAFENFKQTKKFKSYIVGEKFVGIVLFLIGLGISALCILLTIFSDSLESGSADIPDWVFVLIMAAVFITGIGVSIAGLYFIFVAAKRLCNPTEFDEGIITNITKSREYDYSSEAGSQNKYYTVYIYTIKTLSGKTISTKFSFVGDKGLEIGTKVYIAVFNKKGEESYYLYQ